MIHCKDYYQIRNRLQPVESPKLSILRNSRYYRWKECGILMKIAVPAKPTLKVMIKDGKEVDDVIVRKD